MKKTGLHFRKFAWLSVVICCLSAYGARSEPEPVDYVNPYMGNISHLLVPTYPTIHLPNSMLRVYPSRQDFTGDLLEGLPVAVTSHRGSSAFGINPVSGDRPLAPFIKYSYDNEKITPYSYRVYLDEEDVAVSYAPSHQAGIYEFVFGGNDNRIIVSTRNGDISATPHGVSGYQYIDEKTRICLYMDFDSAPGSYETLESGGSDRAVALNFGQRKKVILRYGISFIDCDRARRNMERDIPGYDVAAIEAEGRRLWNRTLSKIEVQGGSEDQKTVFYTSLYRTYERMVNISEEGRYYSAFDHSVHEDSGAAFYTDDWIWDTYRATHPLRVLIEPRAELDMVMSFVRMAQQSPEGWMPTFPEINGDSHRMNGNHAVAAIWDAWCKGLRDFDLPAAYASCKATLTEKTLLPWRKGPLSKLDRFYFKHGFFPALAPGEKETCHQVHPFERRQAISVMLGYSYDCWCAAQMAAELGLKEDHSLFMRKAYSYRNVYNAETGFFHPRDHRGRFIEPFDYRYAGGQGARAYYGENNGWIYRWDVQHNPADLIRMMGGPERFAGNLDAMFREPLGKSKHDFYAQLPDHTGNVGQFSMANEPCLHIPYLYNYAGRPWMTQKRIRTLLDQWFRNDPMGVPGDEDGGGMSAFVVFSMMGFYPVTPGSPTYNIGSPVFEQVKMDLGNGRYFEIIAENYSPGHKYIQSARLNGVEWNKPWFSHSDILGGGQLVLEMGPRANRMWGSGPDDAPPSAASID